jgi:predicted metal-binding protein
VEVREACAANKCGAYGTNWSCPPACDSLKEIETLIMKYQHGLILQTSGELEDSFDYEAMMNIEKEHSNSLKTFSGKIKKIHPNSIVLGAGACTICKKCTYPENPCCFPDKMISSMEAFGIVVSDVCKANDIQYYYGEGTLTYVGCVLIDWSAPEGAIQELNTKDKAKAL